MSMMRQYHWLWLQRGWRIWKHNSSLDPYHGQGTDILGSCSVAERRCGPGRIKYLGQTTVCFKMFPYGSPGIKWTTTWYWGVFADQPIGSTKNNFGSTHGSHPTLPGGCHERINYLSHSGGRSLIHQCVNDHTTIGSRRRPDGSSIPEYPS